MYLDPPGYTGVGRTHSPHESTTLVPLHTPAQSTYWLALRPVLPPETVDHQLVILVVTHVGTAWGLVDGQSGVTARKHYI